MQCDEKVALDELHSSLFGFPQRMNPLGQVAIIGAGCSLATKAVAEISQYYNLTVVNFMSC